MLKKGKEYVFSNSKKERYFKKVFYRKAKRRTAFCKTAQAVY